MTERWVTTIFIDLRGVPFYKRVAHLPFLFKQPIITRHILSREYSEWCALGLCGNNFHKFLYLLDHYILWSFYCLTAVFFGEARGFSWRRPYDFEVTGIKIDLPHKF